MKISGFTFGHNLIVGGYPIKEAINAVLPFVDEIVVVDMQSTDRTRELLNSLSVRIIDGVWNYKAGETLANAHALHTECKNDIVWHFEADEVFDKYLAIKVNDLIKKGHKNISVQRIQIEQNFQRIRWYPHYVHRIFSKGSVIKVGETTDQKNCEDMIYVDDKWGYLWDCTNCFRDNWITRIKQQAKLRNSEALNMLYAPEHIILPNRLDIEMYYEYLQDPLWTTKTTPLDIPSNLLLLVGQTKYNPFGDNND